MKLDRDNLIRARERLGYSIETVAEEAGIAKNSVLRAEHGEDIRPLTARKIAAALGVSVADLYEEAEYPKEGAPPTPQKSFNDVLDEEFDQWLEEATLPEVHKAVVELNRAARTASGEQRYRLVNRATKAINRFTELAGPFTEWKDLRPQTAAADENQEGREAG